MRSVGCEGRRGPNGQEHGFSSGTVRDPYTGLTAELAAVFSEEKPAQEIAKGGRRRLPTKVEMKRRTEVRLLNFYSCRAGFRRPGVAARVFLFSCAAFSTRFPGSGGCARGSVRIYGRLLRAFSRRLHRDRSGNAGSLLR